MYQISLSTYYLMVIRLNWSESRIRAKARRWFHVPLLAGIGLAGASIPYIENNILICSVKRPRYGEPKTLSWIFSIGPITLVVLITSINMILVYLKVRRQYQRGNRWAFQSQMQQRNSSISDDSSSRWLRMKRSVSFIVQRTPPPNRTRGDQMQDDVFWQSVLYLTSFYLSWSFAFAAQWTNVASEIYWFWIMYIAMVPLQGFFNFLVFIRPRIAGYLRERQQQRGRVIEQPSHTSPQSSTFASRGFDPASQAAAPAP